MTDDSSSNVRVEETLRALERARAALDTAIPAVADGDHDAALDHMATARLLIATALLTVSQANLG